ncbi:MAG: alpha/beta hydrolase [Ferruginibacter sp.]
MNRICCILIVILLLHNAKSFSQKNNYPYPLHFFDVPVERTICKMAFMDIAPLNPTGKSIVLFHGKNFNGYYWKDIIPVFTGLGFRVIVPDQPGFGESDKPDLHYSFHQMAMGVKKLLDSLSIDKVCLLGHSMGGMLAVRFALMYPLHVEKMILENPIGLEDYKTFVPYKTLDSLYKKERAATYASYKKYQQTYYPVWKPEYEQYVQEQAKVLSKKDFPQIAWINAVTYQMIFEQPVCYEFKNLEVNTLLIIGTADRTIVGKDALPKSVADEHGQYQLLGKQTQALIRGSILQELPGVGHIPHIQDTAAFVNLVTKFLK